MSQFSVLSSGWIVCLILATVACKPETIYEPAAFEIIVSYDANTVQLKCAKGCAWTDLAFELDKDNSPQSINEMGMVTGPYNRGRSEGGLTPFRFSMDRTGDKIACVSDHGTIWDELSFSCPEKTCSAVIDMSGVTLRN